MDAGSEVLNGLTAQNGRIVGLRHIDAENEALGLTEFGKMSSHGFRADVVQAHPVDERPVGGEAEGAGPRIPLARERRHRAGFHKPEAYRRPKTNQFSVFVKACGQSNRVGKVQAGPAFRFPQRLLQPFILKPKQPSNKRRRQLPEMSRPHSKPMRRLGVELKEEGA